MTPPTNIRPPVLHYRPVRWRDCMWVWRLANDPEVRAASMHLQAIALHAHVRWFVARMRAPLPWWVISREGRRVGMQRIDPTDPVLGSVPVLTTWIHPEERGGRVGSVALAQVRAMLPGLDLRGRIRPENTRSIRACVAAGWVHGAPVGDWETVYAWPRQDNYNEAGELV